MKKFVFATNNPHKLKEVRKALAGGVEILSLADAGFSGEIPETRETLEGNASQKSHYVHKCIQKDCFADDTGLEIEALDGRPGVYSARYAGDDCSFEDNMEKVLSEMEGEDNRKARFRTVISLITDGTEKQFEGVVEGEILQSPAGNKGFGYDPIFKPAGFEVSFAQMPLSEKNRISHRGEAVAKLADFIIGL